MRASPARSFPVLALFLGTACADASSGDDSSSDGASAETAADPTSGPDCMGAEGCACAAGGTCDPGLVCLYDVVCAPEPEPPDTPGDAESDGGDSTDEGAASCMSHDDCAAESVCTADGTCSDSVYDSCYELVVLELVPLDCGDGFGDKELFYAVFLDGVNVKQSTETGCPGNWPGVIVPLPAWGEDPPALQIDFWDDDGFADDPQGSLCFDDGTGGCGGPIPAWVLHEGGFTDDLYNGAFVDIEVELVPCT